MQHTTVRYTTLQVQYSAHQSINIVIVSVHTDVPNHCSLKGAVGGARGHCPGGVLLTSKCCQHRIHSQRHLPLVDGVANTIKHTSA